MTLWANYFELMPEKTQQYERYTINFVKGKNKDVPTGQKLKKCVRLLLKELPDTVPVVSDYRSTILTPITLPYRDKTFLIRYSENESGPDYKFKVEHTGTLTFQDLLDYLVSTNLTREKPSTKEEIIQATNIILASGMKSNPQIITKRNKYFPAGGNLMEKWLLCVGLEAFRGFFMSVRAATGRILLNVQVQHVAVWQEMPMMELLRWLRDKMGYPEISVMIAGIWVRATHLGNKLRRVAGVALENDGREAKHPPKVPRNGANANEVQFWKDSAESAQYVTVAEYFKMTHRALSNPKTPVINVGSRKNPVYMPSELCMIKELQTYERKLPPDATKEMVAGAVRSAPDNARTIVNNGIGLLQQNSQAARREFGVSLNSEMITVAGRVLPGVSLRYSNKFQASRDASWNMIDVRFSTGAQIPAWSYIWIVGKARGSNNHLEGGDFRNMEEVRRVMDDFHQTLLDCGIDAPKPQPGNRVIVNNLDKPGPEIDQMFARAAARFQLLLVILPKVSIATYNEVKRAGDIRHGIHTVSVVAHKRKFCKILFPEPNRRNDNKQYYANVALKFNLKFGGCNQATDLGFVSKGKTMLVGLDVTHPAPGSSEKAPSVSGITASIDGKLGQWPADVAIQSGRAEMITDLKNMFKSRLLLWQKHSKQLPEEIIIYRDGVGENMYDKVRDEELPLVREACRETYPAPDTKANKPYITVVICGKRHHTRFYPTQTHEADPRTGGTKNGTIVDRGVTEARLWDFYLQAHVALQGTPKTAHYVVIHDEIFRRRAAATQDADGRKIGKIATNELQKLTHELCYMFGRATKAVSVCPPAYYADLVCERARVWLSRVFDERYLSESEREVSSAEVRVHERLKDTMFYI